MDMAETAPTFHYFEQLPLELQFKIWKEGIKQTPPRVFELHEHNPVPNYPHRRSSQRRNEPRIKITDLTLYERSVEFQRSLLGVNRISRRENLRYYKRVEFLNAHVWMNMEVDIIYLGHFRQDSLIECFHPGEVRDPFWKTVQHLAFGMSEIGARLERENDDIDNLTWGLKELQDFPALKSLTIVLDTIKEPVRWPPRVNGLITFGNALDVCRSHRREHHLEWMSYLKGQFREMRDSHPEWNVPDLYIKSILRGGRLQKIDWTSYSASNLPADILSIKELQEQGSSEFDDSDLGHAYDFDSGMDEDSSDVDEILVHSAGLVAAISSYVAMRTLVDDNLGLADDDSDF